MKVRIFAKFREIAGADYVDVEATNVKELKEKLSKLFGVNASEVILLINGETMRDDTELANVKEVLAFPPAAGGF